MDQIIDVARSLWDDDLIVDYRRVQDSNGDYTLVWFDLHDGTYVVAGAEYEGDDLVGYTWTQWQIDERADVLQTDGHPDIGNFRKDMTVLARKSLEISQDR